MTATATTADVALPSVPPRAGRLVRLAARLAGDAMLAKSVLSILDQAVVSGASFAVTIILSRLCDKPEVGLYYLALQVVLFARGIQEQLIASPYLVYAGRHKGPAAATYAGSTLAHEAALLAVVSLSLAAAAAWGGASPDVTGMLWLLAAAAPLLLLREFIRQIAFAELKIVEAMVIDISVAALQMAALLAAAWLGMLSTPLTYTLLALGCGLPALAWLVRRRGTFVAQRRMVAADWLHNWRFGRWALGSFLLGQSVPLILPWIVAGTHGAAATAALGAGTTLIGIANMFVLGLSNFICPRAAQAYASGGSKELVGVLQRACAMYLIVLSPLAVGMVLAGSHLMTFVYGPAFADAGPIMAVLACGAVANSLGVTAGNGLWAMELPSANFRADVCALATWIVATAILVPLYGAFGAAIASTAGTAVGAVVRGGVLVSQLRGRPN